MPGAQCATGKPEISISVPVLILSTTDLYPHERRPHCTVLVQLDSVFQVSPGPIDDLSPTLGFDWQTRFGIFVGNELHVCRRLPNPFALDLDHFFAMLDMVVENTRQAQSVRLRSIGVQDNTAVLEMLCGQGLPLDLPNGAWTRRSCSRHSRGQSLEEQCLWTTALDDATPLLPSHRLCRILGTILEVCSCESRLVCLDVHPSFAVAEDNELLFLFHPCFSKLHHALVHVLNGLIVVDVQDAMNGSIGNSIQEQEQESSLGLKRCMA